MKTQMMWVVAGIAVCGSLVAIQGCGKAQAQISPKAQDTRDIQLTIYKEDFALIHETRPVELAAGRTQLRLENVSKALDLETVLFDWQDGKDNPNVVSHTYDLGVRSGGSLLKRLEGKPVEMLWNTQDGKPRDRIEGTLESAQDGGFVIRSGDKLYVNPNGTIVASGEQNLVTMPQLSAEVDSASKQSAQLGFAYQTRGMSWSADYDGRMTADGNAMDFECWATLENHTGVDYPNAKITLVAGSPNRALPTSYELLKISNRSSVSESQAGFGIRVDAKPASAEAVGELYAYNVPALASVGQEQMNRVKMLNSTRVPIKRDYSIRIDNPSYYNEGFNGANPEHDNAQLAIAFVNEDKSGLGMPLPAGPVRIYDSTTKTPVYIGAAGISDTAKNQHVNLTLSKVFDVYSDSRTLTVTRIDKHTIRKSFETVIHNEKKAPVDVRVVESFYNKKHLVSESDPGKQLDAGTRQWTIRVGAGEQKALKWTADLAG